MSKLTLVWDEGHLVEADPMVSAKTALGRILSEPKPTRRVGDTCPSCGRGKVTLRHTKVGSEFSGCSEYPECRWSEDHIVGGRWVAWTVDHLRRRIWVATREGKGRRPVRHVWAEVDDLRAWLDSLEPGRGTIVYYTGAPTVELVDEARSLMRRGNVLDVLFREYGGKEWRLYTTRGGFGAAYPSRQIVEFPQAKERHD